MKTFFELNESLDSDMDFETTYRQIQRTGIEKYVSMIEEKLKKLPDVKYVSFCAQVPDENDPGVQKKKAIDSVLDVGNMQYLGFNCVYKVIIPFRLEFTPSGESLKVYDTEDLNDWKIVIEPCISWKTLRQEIIRWTEHEYRHRGRRSGRKFSF